VIGDPPRASADEVRGIEIDAPLAAALARARRAQRPVLARSRAGMPEFSENDALAWALAHGRRGEPFFVARDGERGRTLAAVGSVALRRAAGAERFEAGTRLRSEILEQCVDGAPDLPAVVGGFAFGAGDPLGAWAGWPAAMWWAPRLCAAAGEGGAAAAVARWAMPDGRVTVPPVEPRPEPRGASEVEGREAFCDRVSEAVAQVAAGRVAKLVLARAVRSAAPPGERIDAAASFAAAAARHARGLAFACGWIDGDAFVGVTPEQLVEVRGRVVRTRALAGTAARSPRPAADVDAAARLLASGKDRCEHDAVIDALRAVLAPHCDELEVSATAVRSTPDVHHLETRFRGVQRGAGDAFAWAERLHPTPAVAGAPRAGAVEALRATEALDRGWYTGGIGYAEASGDGAIWVPLRCALLRAHEAWLYAGAGIVAASDPESEWRETEQKLGTMRAALRTTREGA
jgi:salicylate biosynthesis isochorismate synthase